MLKKQSFVQVEHIANVRVAIFSHDIATITIVHNSSLPGRQVQYTILQSCYGDKWLKCCFES